MKKGSSHSKKLFQIALSAAVVTSAVVAPVSQEAAVTRFKDVKPTDRFYDEIMQLASRGVVSGFKDGTFRSQAALTRAQAAKILCAALKLDLKNVKNPHFKDVNEQHWSYPYAAALAEKGIMTGNGQQEFQPDQFLTRAQMTKVLALSFGFQAKEEGELPFEDVNNEDWFAGYLQSLFNQGVVYGTTPAAYSPNAAVTRGQMAAFIIRSERANKERTVRASIVDISGRQIVTNDGVFKLDSKEETWLHSSNRQALKGAVITFKAKGNTVLTVESIVLTTDHSMIDGHGADMETTVFIEGENIRFENISSAHRMVVRQGVSKFSLNGGIDTLEVNSAKYKNSAAKADQQQPLELNIDGNVRLLKVIEPGVRLLLNQKIKVSNLVLPWGVKPKDVIENYQEILTNIEQVNGEMNPDIPLPGGGGESPSVTIVGIKKVQVLQGLALPAKVTVLMSNQTTREKEVVWPEGLTTGDSGTMTVELTIEGKRYRAEVEISVNPDYQAAKAVSQLIESLPTIIQLSDEANINQADSAFKQLTDHQKAFISITNKEKLAKAVEAIEQLISDKKAADKVSDQISALPAVEDVSLADEKAVMEAKAAYDHLNDSQKALVPLEASKKLIDVFTKLDSLIQRQVAIKAADEAIQQLPELVDIYLNNLKETITLLQAAENAIAEAERKGAVDTDFYGLHKVKGVKEKVKALEVSQQIEELNGLDEPIITEIRSQYNDLSDQQKAWVLNSDKLDLYEQALLVTKLDFSQKGEAFLPIAADITAGIVSVKDEEGGIVPDILSVSGGKVIVQLLDEEQRLKVVLSLTKGDYSVQTKELTITIPAVDRTPPAFLTGYPKQGTVDGTYFDLILNLDKKGTVYYLVTADGAGAPTINQIKHPEHYTGAVKSGSLLTEANVEQTVAVTELNDNQLYHVYLAAEDENGNIQSTPVKLDVQTEELSAIQSKEITNFDFSTIYAGQAQLHSKPMATSDFQGNRKVFTVSDGTVTITVDLWWNIMLNEYATTPAIAIGSAIESSIQQYYIDRNISLYDRTMSAGGWGDTFKISTFKAGASNQVTVGGPDWQYFFDTNTATGTDENHSKNRIFTISDGEKSATIQLTRNMKTMDGLVSAINRSLEASGVKAIAKKFNDQQFEIVAKSVSVRLTTGGSDNGEFFPKVP